MVDQSTSQTREHSGQTRRGFIQRVAWGAAGGAVALAEARPAAAGGIARKCVDIDRPMEHVHGKVAFITGGSSGIGLGISRACLEAGMNVVIGYRSKENVAQAVAQLPDVKGRVHTIDVDVTDRRRMEEVAAETIRVFGKVHLLVNNAGVITNTPLSTSTYEDWDWVLNVNVTGVFNGLRAFLPRIREHGEGGQVLTTSSVNGLVVSGAIGLYSTSKFAAVGMMEALRSELTGTGIGVSVVCPGYVKSNLWDAARNRPARLANTTSEPLDQRKRAQLQAAVENAGEASMDPIEVGRLVLRGIRNNDLYILTHPEFEQGIRDRNEALISAIPEDRQVPEARVAAERSILRNPIYLTERDRKRCPRVP